MSTLGLTRLKTNEGTSGQEDPAWDLITQVVSGKLSVEAACERGRIRQEDAPDWLRGVYRSARLAYDEQLRQVLIRQGATAEGLSSPELILPVSEISVVDWIQAIQLFAKDAVITVVQGAGESRLWYSRGALIDAESGGLRGEAAVYRIVGLERGQIVTELRAVRRERTIRKSTQSLLLEAAQRKDEANLLRRRLGNLERYFEARDLGPNRSFNTSETAALRLFATPCRLVDVLERSDVGDVETLAALENLIRIGVLSEVPPPAASSAVSSTVPRLDGGEPRGEPLERVSETSERRVSQWLALPPAHAPAAPPRPRVASQNNVRWAASTVCMAVVVFVAAWLGARPPASDAATASVVESSRTRAPEPVGSYPLVIRVFPEEARLELDGQEVEGDPYTAILARDGTQHELLVSADGFAPARILFVDTPPPADIQLEPLLAAVDEPAPALLAPVHLAPTVLAPTVFAPTVLAPTVVLAAEEPRRWAREKHGGGGAASSAGPFSPGHFSGMPPSGVPPTGARTSAAPCPSPKCQAPSIRLASHRGQLPKARQRITSAPRPPKTKPNVQIIDADATTAGRN